jgi:membrane-bound serine protease (ClpP class)
VKKFFLLLSALFVIFPFGVRAERTKYAVIHLDGSVNPISAEYITESLKKAQTGGMSFIIFTIDTPGGLIGSMREIIKEILVSKIPVVTYTYPKGAQAASAGGFIMLSGHVAAMSPGTEIGAMHPVSPVINFDDIGDEKTKKQSNVMAEKILNDTVAYARSIAQKRGRNQRWTEDAVRKAISSTYKEAKKEGIIDIIAEDVPDLLRQLDGYAIDLNGKKTFFSTKDAVAVEYGMSSKQRVMNFFADPQIVFFLFIIAVAGIVFEIKSPGLIVPGVVGVLSLIVFLMAVRILPVNVVGIILIMLSITLFILELYLTSYGLLTIGGIAAFIAGSLILFDSGLPGFSISPATILTAVLVILGIVFGVMRAVIRTHRGSVTTGAEGLAGLEGTALSDISRTMQGRVFVRGESWQARSDEPIAKGDSVRVSGVNGLTLTVIKNPEQNQKG